MDKQESRENGYLVDTDTEMEHCTVHDTEELESNTNKKLTNVIYETEQNDEVLDKTIDFDAAE